MIIRHLERVFTFDHAGDQVVYVDRHLQNLFGTTQHVRIDSGTAYSLDVGKYQFFIQNGY